MNEEKLSSELNARALSDEDLARVTGGKEELSCLRWITGASPKGECSFYDPNNYICVVDCKGGDMTPSSIGQDPPPGGK